MPDRRLIDDLMIGAVDVLPEGALEEKLALAEREGRPLRVKLGVDPTAPDIHLGHTVVLNKLRQFQDAGHTVVLIIGDYTARIGDPSGRSKTRPRLDGAVIDANARTYQEQALLILDDDPAKLEVRYNGEWLAPLTMEQLFEITATTTVARILERDDFAKRWEAHQPISVLEMLYPFAQGYDSVAIRADIEIGGTDQVFNLFMGRDLQQYFGQAPQAIMTLDILPGTDGVERMSKSTGNYIGVTEDPRDVYGKVMSVPDEVLMTYYRLLTSAPRRRVRAARGRPGRGRRGAARRQGAPGARDHHAAARRRGRGRGGRALRQGLPPPRGRRRSSGARPGAERPRGRLGLPAQGHGALVRPHALRGAAAHRAGRRDARRRARHDARRPRRPARRPPPQGRQVGHGPGPHPRPLTAPRRICLRGL